MNHTRTAAIVGGDVRQVFLGELLAADGMRVGTVGLERHVCELPIFCDMAALFAEADVVLLPMPVTRDETYLHAPLANAPYRLKDVLDAIPAGTSVYGGAIPQTLYEPARRREIRLYDYLKQEELALLNAIPTAEGAIQIAMEQLPVTIHDLPVLVIGAGRIGSAVAMRLRGLGARILPACTARAIVAWIHANWKGSCIRFRSLSTQFLRISSVGRCWRIVHRTPCCWIWRPEKAASVRTRKIFAASFTR